MAEKKTQKETTAASHPAEQQPAPVGFPVVVQQPATTETVCKMCGHINRGDSLICEMCSNYLFD